MKKLQETKPIWHAVLWILLYVGVVNIGDNIANMPDLPNLVTAGLLAVFSVALVAYIRRNNWVSLYGLGKVTRADFRKAWYFAPLVVIGLSQLAKGIDFTLSSREMLLAFGLMLSVGFIEEVIFRGFLYQAILKESNVTRAVLISGITFGIGHIVNLLRGYTATEQIIQIIAGIVLGIMLALVVAVTNKVLPAALFHIALNTIANITNENQQIEIYALVGIVIISTVYSIYLVGQLKKQSAKQFGYSLAD